MFPSWHFVFTGGDVCTQAIRTVNPYYEPNPPAQLILLPCFLADSLYLLVVMSVRRPSGQWILTMSPTHQHSLCLQWAPWWKISALPGLQIRWVSVGCEHLHGDVVQLVEHQTSTRLRQVQFPGAVRDFSPDSVFSADCLKCVSLPCV